MPILSQLQTYVAGAVAALCVLIGVALGWYAPWVGGKAQVHRADARTADMSQKLALANTSLLTCEGNARTLNASLAAQNAAVDALKADGDRRTAAATKAVHDAQAATASLRTRAAAVMAEKPVGSACAAADRLILGSLGR